MIIGLLKGLIVGIIVSIPVGPLGLLCIPRTLARGRRAGLAVGLGGSASDMLYSALALFALSFISSFIDAHKGWVLLAGGLIISITGIRLLVSRRQVRHPDSVTARAVSPVRHIEGALNGFLISVTNPGTLVCMLWLFTFLNVDTATPSVMAAEWAGTSLGSATSWFLITWIISTFRDRITIGQLHILTRIYHHRPAPHPHPHLRSRHPAHRPGLRRQEPSSAPVPVISCSATSAFCGAHRADVLRAVVVRGVVLLAGGLPGWMGRSPYLFVLWLPA